MSLSDLARLVVEQLEIQENATQRHVSALIIGSSVAITIFEAMNMPPRLLLVRRSTPVQQRRVVVYSWYRACRLQAHTLTVDDEAAACLLMDGGAADLIAFPASSVSDDPLSTETYRSLICASVLSLSSIRDMGHARATVRLLAARFCETT